MKIIKGTANRYLDINLNSQSWSVYHISKNDLKNYMGGKGLALKIFHDRFTKKELGNINPFGPENLLIFSIGVMLTSGAPCTGRFEVLTKSPLTGLMVGSSSGGYFGEACKTAGWDGIIIQGVSPHLQTLRISADGVVFEKAEDLRGMGTGEVQRALKLTPKEGAAVIGPAGENKVLYANICSGHRFAGRGGVGAVMGSKNIKAIVARGKEFGYEPVLQEKFDKTVKKAKKYINRNSISKAYRAFGTNTNTRIGMKKGYSAVHNFRDRYNPETEKITGELMAQKYKTRHSSCRHCSILCGHKGHYPDGQIRQIPEYETMGMFGSNIDNYNPDIIGEWNQLMNELGIDTISAGSTIAWAMEAGEKGIRKTSLEFGRTDNIGSILKEIAYKRGEGKELSEGSRRLSEKYGGKEYAIHVKGLECAAYDPRSSWGHGLSYAVHNKGGCHLGSYLISLEQILGYLPPHTTLSKANWVIFMEDLFTGVNSLQICLFSVFGIITEPPIPKYLPKPVLNAATLTMPSLAMALMNWSILSNYFWSITGIRMNKWDFLKTGERINKLERWMNVQMGMRSEDDTLPRRFTEEKQTPFPGKNTVVPIKKMVKRYYKLRKYDSNGGPKDSDLKRLMSVEQVYRNVKPSVKIFKTLYCTVVLKVLEWFIPAVACRKESVKELIREFPEDFTFRLGVWPKGPSAAFRREKDILKKISSKHPVDMTVMLKSIDAAWLLFSFQESTVQSEANNRLTVSGALPHSCTFIRLMDKTEILLLPKFLARKAVKKWEKVK